MAAQPIPYPPSPAWVPADLTDLGADSTRDTRAVLTALVLFLSLYALLLLGCLAVVVGGVILSIRYFVCAGLPLIAIGGLVGLLLVLVLFRRTGADASVGVEVTAGEQPVLFGFLRKLAREVGAPAPDRVFVTPDVNAAVVPDLTLANLFVRPRQELHIGLGLVNVLTLSEFKAVMGHEFGHFAQQNGRRQVYTEVAMRILNGLQGGEGWVAREMKAAGRATSGDGQPGLSAFLAVVVGGPMWVVSKLAGLLFHLVHVSSLSLSRSHEFHADRVAVSVAGSNAIVHGLARINFAEEALSEACRVLGDAADHNLYTRDVYAHHTAAARRLRRVRRDPRLGLPPVLRAPEDGKHVRVFDDEDDDGPPLMWRTHPPNHDRERSVKRAFVPAPEDDRSPWVLFEDADDLRERVTYRFYRAVFGVKKSVRLRPAAEVQAFLDEADPEVAFDPKYGGAYDDRWIVPGELEELTRMVDDEPWDDGRIGRTHGRLYLEIGGRADDFRDLVARIRKVYRKAYGRPTRWAARRIRELEEELEHVLGWFRAFDRRVFLIHAQMATRLGPDVLRDLSDRYRFHFEVQGMHRDLFAAADRVEDALGAVLRYGESELPPDFFNWVRDACQGGRAAMVECSNRARLLVAPEIPGVPKGRIGRIVFDKDVLGELPRYHIPARWVNKLLRQMSRMRGRLRRLDFQSLGELLRVQDRIAAAWAARGVPEAARVFHPPPLPPGGASRSAR